MNSSLNDAQTCIILSEARLDLAPSTPIAYPSLVNRELEEVSLCLKLPTNYPVLLSSLMWSRFWKFTFIVFDTLE